MDLDRLRFGIGLALVALTTAMSFTVASASEAQTSRGVTYDQTCGLLPGEGAYGYIRVKNISCGAGKRAAFKARKKYCSSRNRCEIDPFGNIEKVYRGKVRRNGWICKVAIRWEYLRIKCRKEGMFLIWQSGA